MTRENDEDVRYWKAFVAAQKDLQDVLKTAENSFLHSKYAPLSEVLAKVRPVLNKHGLAVSQPVSGVEYDSSDKHRFVCVETAIVHENGSAQRQRTRMPIADGASAQDVGAAITYARRYGLTAILGIAETNEDVDGRSQSSNRNTGVTPTDDKSDPRLERTAVDKIVSKFNSIGDPDHRMGLPELQSFLGKEAKDWRQSDRDALLAKYQSVPKKKAS